MPLINYRKLILTVSKKERSFFMAYTDTLHQPGPQPIFHPVNLSVVVQFPEATAWPPLIY